ncbi:hypothetical protein Hdeb2414_s0004g00148841 [Helianthus debilis subsp. tardiflorus]
MVQALEANYGTYTCSWKLQHLLVFFIIFTLIFPSLSASCVDLCRNLSRQGFYSFHSYGWNLQSSKRDKHFQLPSESTCLDR